MSQKETYESLLQIREEIANMCCGTVLDKQDLLNRLDEVIADLSLFLVLSLETYP